MKRSQLFMPTAKEEYHDAAIPSHQLLLRAGYMRKSANGTFMLLPLAVRVVEKFTKIIDREMALAGAQKLSMPILLSQELWERTGRWNTAGSELMRLRDRHGKGFCLGPTHEEIFTDLVAHEVSSHRQLPLTLYQIGTKFRDEIRPRFGLLRAREFIMKDAYSFHADVEDAERMYSVMNDAYTAIFNEVGCDWVKVEADGGNIGSGQTHEFHILSDIGEDQLLHCPECGYASNDERAVSAGPATTAGTSKVVLLAPVDLESSLAAAATADLDSSAVPSDMLRRFSVVIDRDSQVNAQKVANAAGCDFELCEVDPDAFPHIAAEDLVDLTAAVSDAVCDGVQSEGGALVGDFRLAQAGESCASCSSDVPLLARRGIEVGQIFRLGTKYSETLDATFDDANGKRQPMEMGCYGIGVSRVLAAAVESLHDSAGIIWPDSLAPFRVVVMTAGKQQYLQDTSTKLAADLSCSGADVLLDDRWGNNFGSKITEAELAGHPFVVIVGRDMHPEKGNGRVEVRHRASGRTELLRPEDVADFVATFNKTD